MKPERVELLSWGRVHAMVRQLAFSIRQSDFHPDLVVAIARGGFVPARILCDYLAVSELAEIGIKHYGPFAAKERARVVTPVNCDVAGRTVLIVDDLTDTGETLKLAAEHVRRSGPAAVKTALLLYKKSSPVAPDFYAHRVRVWRWIIYPWAVIEDVGGMLDDMETYPSSPEDAQQEIQDRYKIHVPLKTLADIFSLKR